MKSDANNQGFNTRQAWEDPYKVIHYSRKTSYHPTALDGMRLPRPWKVEHLKRYY